MKEISRGEERKFIRDIVKDIESNIPDQLNENKNLISGNYSIGIPISKSHGLKDGEFKPFSLIIEDNND